MTASEYRYLTAINDLSKDSKDTRLISVAKKLAVSKVSAYKAIERLEKNGYVGRLEKNKLKISETGKDLLKEYEFCISMVQCEIEKKYGLDRDTAYSDALNLICAISNEGRRAILNYHKDKRVD